MPTLVCVVGPAQGQRVALGAERKSRTPLADGGTEPAAVIITGSGGGFSLHVGDSRGVQLMRRQAVGGYAAAVQLEPRAQRTLHDGDRLAVGDVAYRCDLPGAVAPSDKRSRKRPAEADDGPGEPRAQQQRFAAAEPPVAPPVAMGAAGPSNARSAAEISREQDELSVRQALLDEEILSRRGLEGAERARALKGLQAMRAASVHAVAGVLRGEPDQGFRQAAGKAKKAAADGDRKEKRDELKHGRKAASAASLQQHLEGDANRRERRAAEAGTQPKPHVPQHDARAHHNQVVIRKRRRLEEEQQQRRRQQQQQQQQQQQRPQQPQPQSRQPQVMPQPGGFSFHGGGGKGGKGGGGKGSGKGGGKGGGGKGGGKGGGGKGGGRGRGGWHGGGGRGFN